MSTRVTISKAKELVDIIMDAYNRDVDIIVEPSATYESVSFTRYINKKAVVIWLHGFVNNKHVMNSATLNVMHNMYIYIKGGFATIDPIGTGALIEFPIRIKSHKSSFTSDRDIEISHL